MRFFLLSICILLVACTSNEQKNDQSANNNKPVKEKTKRPAAKENAITTIRKDREKELVSVWQVENDRVVYNIKDRVFQMIDGANIRTSAWNLYDRCPNDGGKRSSKGTFVVLDEKDCLFKINSIKGDKLSLIKLEDNTFMNFKKR